jgi:hypothetical protein
LAEGRVAVEFCSGAGWCEECGDGALAVTGIIVFVQKFIGIILVAASALFYKLKDLFKKKKEEPIKEV